MMFASLDPKTEAGRQRSESRHCCSTSMCVEKPAHVRLTLPTKPTSKDRKMKHDRCQRRHFCLHGDVQLHPFCSLDDETYRKWGDSEEEDQLILSWASRTACMGSEMSSWLRWFSSNLKDRFRNKESLKNNNNGSAPETWHHLVLVRDDMKEV